MPVGGAALRGAMGKTDLVRLKLFGVAKRTIDERRAKGGNIPGLLRLLRYAYRVFKPRGIILTETQGFEMYLDTTDDVMTPEILVYGVHEPNETESMRSVLRPGMTVLDIGANTGYYSLLAANVVGNQGRVYAFEPEPHNFWLLTENIRLNQLTNIIAIQKAISDKTGKMKLYKDRWNFGAHTAAENNIEVEQGTCVEVDTITLDDFCAAEDITQVDYIKADVQGSEGLVFQHAGTLLRNRVLTILMEFWPHALRNLGTEPGSLLELFRRHHFDFCVLGDRGSDEISGTDELVRRAEREKHLSLLLEKGYVPSGSIPRLTTLPSRLESL